MIRLRLLGSSDLRGTDGEAVGELAAQPRRLALLTYLALAAPAGFVRRDSLIAMFWPDSDTERARNALRQTLHQLRRALGPGVLNSRGLEEVGLDPARFWCDAGTFRRAVREGHRSDGVALYAGELLPGFFISGAPEFDRWLDQERVELRGLALESAWSLADAELAAGQTGAATHWARWAANLAPDDEATVRRLVELLVAAGDRAGASRHYEDFAQRLLRDFDSIPAPETGGALRHGAVARPVRRTPESAMLPPPPERATAPPQRLSGSRPWIRWVVAGGAGLVGVLAIARLRQPSLPPSLPAVVVLPFTVRGSPQLAYLQTGMVDLLSSRLDGGAGFRSADPRAAVAAVGDSAAPLDPERAAQVAAKVGATRFVIGDLVEVGGRLEISAALFNRDRPGAPLARATVEGESADILGLVDRLAGRLLVGEGAGGDTLLTGAARLTTASLPAFQAYLEGETAFRNGRYGQAMDAFQRAAAADTGFALAYYRLAVTADWTGQSARSVEYVRAAERHADRLSPLVKDLLYGFDTYAARQADFAEGWYQNLSASHPENLEALYMLGEIRFHYDALRGRSPEEAREPFERVLSLAPRDGPTLIHLARLNARAGRGGAGDTLLQRFLTLYPGGDRAIEMRALRAFAGDDRAAQDRIVAELRRAGRVTLEVVSRGVGALNRDLAGAARVAELYLTPGEDPAYTPRGRILLAQIEVGQGRWQAARAELRALASAHPDLALITEASLALTPDLPVTAAELRDLRARLAATPTDRGYDEIRPVWAASTRTFLAGMLSARLGDLTAARRARTDLDTPVAGDSGVRADLASLLRARLAGQAGDPQQGLTELGGFRFEPQTVLSGLLFQIPPLARFLRAELLMDAGRNEEAAAWLSSFPDPAGVDLAFLGSVSQREGDLLERAGRRADAAVHFAQAVQTWRGCEPAFEPLRSRTAQRLYLVTSNPVSAP